MSSTTLVSRRSAHHGLILLRSVLLRSASRSNGRTDVSAHGWSSSNPLGRCGVGASRVRHGAQKMHADQFSFGARRSAQPGCGELEDHPPTQLATEAWIAILAPSMSLGFAQARSTTSSGCSATSLPCSPARCPAPHARPRRFLPCLPMGDADRERVAFGAARLLAVGGRLQANATLARRQRPGDSGAGPSRALPVCPVSVAPSSGQPVRRANVAALAGEWGARR